MDQSNPLLSGRFQVRVLAGALAWDRCDSPDPRPGTHNLGLLIPPKTQDPEPKTHLHHREAQLDECGPPKAEAMGSTPMTVASRIHTSVAELEDAARSERAVYLDVPVQIRAGVFFNRGCGEIGKRTALRRQGAIAPLEVQVLSTALLTFPRDLGVIGSASLLQSEGAGSTPAGSIQPFSLM